ncbi:MAG: sugar phosphate isomerase/epimerase [Clostridia bacterium]|nr:sugar phosphate isomerase/epimerase [Clostridia bacterium]
MRTGVCTTDFEHIGVPLRNADSLFGVIRNYGFECVQFAFSSVAECNFVPTGEIEIPAYIPYAAVVNTDRAAQKYSLPIEVINGTFNMAHPDASVREEGLRRFAILTEAAEALGAKYISLCSGSRNAAHLWTWSPDNDTEEAWDAMFDTVKRATELAEKRNIVLAIESEAANIIDTPENARKIMDAVGSQNLKMILDCANLFHRGMARPENVRTVLGHAFELFGSDIVIAHGKDIREGDGIDFCGTGLGIVDFAFTAARLREYGYSGDMFLHGIYDEDDMPRALAHWKACL